MVSEFMQSFSDEIGDRTSFSWEESENDAEVRLCKPSKPSCMVE